MKSLRTILNSVSHNRLAKGIKKSLCSMGVEVSHSQLNEAIAKTAGFPDFHAAQKEYAKALTPSRYVVSISGTLKIEYNYGNESFPFIRNYVFQGFENKNKNFYELSKRICFYDIEYNSEMNEKLVAFLETTLDFFPEEDEDADEDYLDINLYNIFAHNEYSQHFDKVFAWDENFIKGFDEIFSEVGAFCIENEGSDLIIESVEILDATEQDIDFMIKNGLISEVIEKDLKPRSFS